MTREARFQSYGLDAMEMELWRALCSLRKALLRNIFFYMKR